MDILPILTPVSESEVRTISPVPFGVRVRFALVSVPINASAPLPRLRVVESIPSIAAASIEDREEAVRALVPERTVVLFVRVVVSPRVILVTPALSNISLPPTLISAPLKLITPSVLLSILSPLANVISAPTPVSVSPVVPLTTKF